jgi:hypothetical protein
MTNNSNYYVNRKPKLMKDFNKIINIARKILGKSFNKSKVSQILDESKRKYEALLPQLPYIGGKKNMSTFNIIEGAWMLAIIFPLEQEGLSVREIGKIMYEILKTYFESTPLANWLNGKLMWSKFMIKRKKCGKTTFKQYSGGWVEEFVEGDGKSFDYGLTITECGLCKLYKQYKAEQYVPYLCLTDYPLFRAYGIGFTRTQTIANGAPMCDFRFKKGGKTPEGWPQIN